MRDEFGFFAGAETCPIVSLTEPAPELGDELRRPARKRANFRARLTVTDRTRPVGDMNGDKIRCILALRAVTRLTIHGRAGTVEDDLEAEISVRDAGLRAGEACEDALALAPQVFDRFEQVAVLDQEARI